MRNVLRSLWQGWKVVASRIGHWQTRLVLSFFYFVVMLPVAVGVRLLADPLGLKGLARAPRWRPRDYPSLSLEQARRQ